MIRLILLLNIFSLTLTAQDWGAVEINPEKLNDHIYMLSGAGGNMAISIGEDGIILIDDQFAELSDKIIRSIKSISNQPIKYVINTHWHGDHTGGNEAMAKHGSVIISHDNVRERMSSEQFVEHTNRTVPPANTGALPIITFDHSIQIHQNNEDIIIIHHHAGHTDGDAIVFFQTSNIIHMGDTYFESAYPFVDWSSGGSVDGLLKTLNSIIILIDDQTKVIPGHGKVSGKIELIAYRNNIQTTRDIALSQINKGVSLEDMLSADLFKAQNELWGGGWITPKDWAKTLYRLYGQ